MTAAQYSGSPFPFPIRVSKGMEVIGLCGKTRTYSRPSLRMYCCAAMRPASTVCAGSQPPWTACRPKSPWTTRLPRVALPLIRPLWLFRCFTLLGISAMFVALVIHALVDPNLHADVPLCRQGLGEPIIDLRPQRRKRNRSGDLLLAA